MDAKQTMEFDPVETVEKANSAAERASSRLNILVAITVSLMATFMGICKVKDDNIVQAMQQAQANKLDHWAFYQARNIRQEVAKSTLVQLELSALSAPAARQADYQAAMATYKALVADQEHKKQEVKQQADQDQREYDAANYRDDQFDISDAFLAIAVALLAMTSLTQQKWLYVVAMFPTTLGVIMGLAGLCSWQLHPGWLVSLLT